MRRLAAPSWLALTVAALVQPDAGEAQQPSVGAAVIALIAASQQPGGSIDGAVAALGAAISDLAPTCATVAFYQNNAPSGGDGSEGAPFNSLPSFGNFAADVLYLRTGTGTTLNQAGGVILFDGQKLIGESIGYFDQCNSIPATITASKPAITNPAGAAVSLLGNNEVAGVRVVDPLLGINGTLLANTDIHDNVLEGTGISITFASGSHRVAANKIASPGAAIGVLLADNGGTADFAVTGNTITGGDGEGVVISTSAGGTGTTTVLNNTITDTDNEAVQIIERGGTTTVGGNTIRGARDVGVYLDHVVGSATVRDNAISNTLGESVLVENDASQALAVTIADNVLEDNQPAVDNFSDGISIVLRDDATVTGSIADNRVDDAGRHGILVEALESGSTTVTITGNEVNDPDFSGLLVRWADGATSMAEVRLNTVRRSGRSGIEFNTSGATFGDHLARDNVVVDAGMEGMSFALQGDFTARIVADANRIDGSADQGLDLVIDSGPADSPFLTAALRGNESTSGGEEGIRVLNPRNSDAHVHVEDNRVGFNAGDFDVWARSTGGGALCIALAGNESFDGNYLLQVRTEGILTYEDALGSNSGIGSPVVTLLNDAQFPGTIGPTAAGSCRGVEDAFPGPAK